MAFVELIRFRKLDNELTDNEFFNKFCKTIGRQTIISALYQYFSDRPTATQNATNIQTNIMLKRKVKPEQQSSCNCVDELPSQVISKCASFLPFLDYFHFAQCNRTIYYSCYSPSKIYELDMVPSRLALPKKAYVLKKDTNVFKNVRKLSMDLNKFDEWSTYNQSVWANNNALQDLKLYFADDRWSFQLVDKSKIKSFLQNARIKCDNLRSLTLCGFVYFTFETLMKFASKNVVILDIQGSENRVYSSADEEKIRQKFPNIKEIKLNSNAICRLYLNAFQNQVESVEICRPMRHSEHLNIAPSFPKLRSLAFSDTNDYGAFSNVRTLKSLSIFFCVACSDMPDVEDGITLAFKQNNLEQLEIFTFQYNPPIALHEISAALVYQNAFDVDGLQNCLHIKFLLNAFRTKKNDTHDNDEIGLIISKICQQLNQLRGNKWKLDVKIWELKTKFNVCINKDGLEELKSCHTITWHMDEYIDWEKEMVEVHIGISPRVL